MSTTHVLKCWPGPFDDVFRDEKKFEIRKNDRDFKVGDGVILREWNPTTEQYTGKRLEVDIDYIIYGGQFGLPGDICVFCWADDSYFAFDEDLKGSRE